MDGDDSFYAPIDVSSRSVFGFNTFEEGLNDPEAIQVDYTKAKALAIDILVYDNKKLFKENQGVKVDAKINLANLKYLGELPEDFKKIIDPDEGRYLNIDGSLFMHSNDYYVIRGNDVLTKITKGKADLKSFKRLNEFYYTFKGKLFGHEDFRHYNNRAPQLTDKDIDLSKLKVFEVYFTDGIDIWYKYIKMDKTLREITINPYIADLKATSLPQTIKTYNIDIPRIAFDKLKKNRKHRICY
ncbi:MAG TPA: hypothetical protein VF677_14730 [Flavobacterium sp.]|jgi:hypothetical protein